MFRIGGDVVNRNMFRNASMNNLVSGHIMDSTQDLWDGLSDVIKSYLSRSVASIALCDDGDNVVFSCSGIAVERQWYDLRILTTASLVKILNSFKKKRLEIQVRLEGDEVYTGFVDEASVDDDFAFVVVSGFDDDVQFGPFQRALESMHYGRAFVAIGRDVSGKIIAKSVEVAGDFTCHDEDFENEDIEPWEGGPLLFVDHVVGMNIFLTMTRAIFRPWFTIRNCLFHYSYTHQKDVIRFGARPLGEKSVTYPHTVQGQYYFKNEELIDLDSNGYPKLPSTMLGAGMILVNMFEETFGTKYDDGGVWKNFKYGASNIRRNIVALASFTGGQRFFACTGFFVKWIGSPIILTSASLIRSCNDDTKIVTNLKIQVLLPNNQCTEGTLQHYNLHYNVALVSVNDYRAHRPLNAVPKSYDHFEVAAVGCCFKSRALLATCGHLVNWTGTLDCEFLLSSTCKITKAGIGGPLVNLRGDVVGMNFYDKRIGTPYLPWEVICKILAVFEKSKPVDFDNDGAPFYKMDRDDQVMLNSKLEVGSNSDPPAVSAFWKLPEDKTVLNRWPVPMPHWRHPEFLDEDKSDEDEDDEDEDELFHEKYTYMNGIKYTLY